MRAICIPDLVHIKLANLWGATAFIFISSFKFPEWKGLFICLSFLCFLLIVFKIVNYPLNATLATPHSCKITSIKKPVNWHHGRFLLIRFLPLSPSCHLASIGYLSCGWPRRVTGILQRLLGQGGPSSWAKTEIDELSAKKASAMISLNLFGLHFNWSTWI